jgi:YegS/Rv2252/BmrU family lipid kinase
MDKGWFIIINPVSGGKRGRKVWETAQELLKKKGIPFECQVTSQALDASDIARTVVEQGYRKIFLIGGDGTLNEVINGVLEQKTVPSNEVLIGIASVGTGNDFIKTLNIPSDYKKALALMTDGKERVIDSGLVSYYFGTEKKQRYFVNVAGMAFDAEVTRYANLNKGGGAMAYHWSLVRSLFVYKSTKVKLQTENATIEQTCFCVNITNCKYAGGGMMVAPQAVPDDGLFAITYFGDLTKWEVIKNIPALFKGSFLDHPKIKVLSAKNVKVSSDTPIHLEVEGETLGTSPFEFTMLPGSIRILVP